MKTFQKALLVALVAIFSFGYASAEFRFGVKAGLNFNKLDYKFSGSQEIADQLKDPSNQTGWMAGVMAEFTIPIINIGADASILYAHQSVGANEAKYYGNKDFLDIPVNLKWKIGIPAVGKIISPIIYTGPDFLFALNKNKLDLGIDCFEHNKKCEVGWNVGIGVELLQHLQIDAGYCFGLNDVVDCYMLSFSSYYPDVDSWDLKAKKNYWTVTVAYLF